MYLAIDVGGSKTLVAAFSVSGELKKTYKFATSQDYTRFKSQLSLAVKSSFNDIKLTSACCGVPGRIDRSEGMALGYGTLKWPPAPIAHDLKKLLDIPVAVENDAKLAGLFEAISIDQKYSKVLYITIGTGIGTALLVDGQIDDGMVDSEGGQIWLTRGGKKIQWEDLVSGRAIKERFHKRAAEINDARTWGIICEDMAEGMFNLIAAVQPDALIIGGGVGAHLDKFGKLLNDILQKMATDLVPIPPIIKAKKAEEAVIYGCYQYLKNIKPE